jgi:hypothetical protein
MAGVAGSAPDGIRLARDGAEKLRLGSDFPLNNKLLEMIL